MPAFGGTEDKLPARGPAKKPDRLAGGPEIRPAVTVQVGHDRFGREREAGGQSVRALAKAAPPEVFREEHAGPASK